MQNLVTSDLVTSDEISGTHHTTPDEMKRRQVLADYFTGVSSFSGDSFANSFEFYEELKRIDFDITKNKKIMALFQAREIRNETVLRKIQEKQNMRDADSTNEE